jgi:hypothetical protein
LRAPFTNISPEWLFNSSTQNIAIYPIEGSISNQAEARISWPATRPTIFTLKAILKDNQKFIWIKAEREGVTVPGKEREPVVYSIGTFDCLLIGACFDHLWLISLLVLESLYFGVIPYTFQKVFLQLLFVITLGLLIYPRIASTLDTLGLEAQMSTKNKKH